MNKQQAKATIESESLLKQEAKQKITTSKMPVSVQKYTDEPVHNRITPKEAEIITENPIDDMLASDLYVEAKNQMKGSEKINRGSEVRVTEGPLSLPSDTRFDVLPPDGKVTGRKFTNKRPDKEPVQTEDDNKRSHKKVHDGSRYETKNAVQDTGKLFKVTEDKISDIVAEKRRTNTKLTETELRQKAYFSNKLEEPRQVEAMKNMISDDEIVYKTVSRNRSDAVKTGAHKRIGRGIFSSAKYHVSAAGILMNVAESNYTDNDDDQQNHLTDSVISTAYHAPAILPGSHRFLTDKDKRNFGSKTTVKKPEKVREKSVHSSRIKESKNSRFIPGAAKKKIKSSVIMPADLKLEERRALTRFINHKKHDDLIFYDMKTSLFRKIYSKIKQIVKKNSIGVIIAAVCIAFLLSAVGSAGILFEGVSQATGVYLSGLSLSTDFDMTDCENYYTKKEADLQDVLDNIEEYYPGYDRYVIESDDEIGHDALKLMAYLSAVYEGYDLGMIKGVLDDLFDDMYVVTTEVETVMEEEEEISIFSFKIVKTDWETLMASRIGDPDRDLYDSYEEHGGGHQAFHNPFNINWSEKITSEFGWRIHPISGKEKFHKGVDIGMPSGTPVKSCSQGIVVKSTCTDVEGNYVVVEDETGYRCHYMHLSERNVNEGDVVDYDTIIGKVGSTGYSTGPHLHLQITDPNGECLNPIFLVQGGY